MSTLTIATDGADAAAIEAIERHHAELAGALTVRVQRLLRAAAADRTRVPAARDDLVTWCRTELLPHAAAEEEALYPPAHRTTEGRLLVSGMVDEHRVIADLIDRLEGSDGVEAAATATALQVVFDGHARKENELVLPLLAGTPGVSLAALLEGMHAELGGAGHAEAASQPAGGHACGCHEHDDGVPELDARAVPHAIRHATIFGALDGVAPGAAMVLVAPHDPLPLLAQIEERDPGAFTVDYLERGPEAWRLRFTRTGS